MELVGKYCKDCKVFTDNVDENALELIYSIMNHKVFEGSKIRIMPDVHAGKGIVIGFSSKMGNYVSPAHVGCDIGCMMTTMLFNKIIDTNIDKLENLIKTNVKFGFSIHDKSIVDKNDFYKYVSHELKSLLNINVNVDEKYISKMLNRVGMDESTFWRSLGTVGGGNHFIEVGINEDKNLTGITVHCGSRNFGVKVFKYWDIISNDNKISKDKLKELIDIIKKNEPDKRKWDLLIKNAKSVVSDTFINGYLSGNNLKGYLNDMVICQAYAKYNHKIITKIISDIVFNLYRIKCTETIQSVHNYIDFRDNIIRKGAIRSYVGEKMVIPFNMRDGLAICEGKSNDDWNCTAPHGAGRILARGKAKELISMDEYIESMKGIYTTSVSESTIDESPMAYKDYKEILENIKPTCNVLYLLKPIINIKSE